MLRRTTAVATLIAAVVCVLAGWSAASSPLDGWERPNRVETSDAWRRVHPARALKALGDFDGDGRRDSAVILVNRSAEKAGIWFFPSANPGSPVCLDSSMTLGILPRTGIERLRAGRYATACGKGYWPCDSTETDTLRLKADGLLWFMEESASSCLWWDAARRSWRNTALSD